MTGFLMDNFELKRKDWFLFFILVLMALLPSCTKPALSLQPSHFEMLVSLDGEEDDYYQELILRDNGRVVDGRRARWSSDHEEVAVVDRSGWVTSKGVGTATITVKYMGGTATCTVEVKRKITSDTVGFGLEE